MADITTAPIPRLWRRIDKTWGALVVILLLLVLLDPGQFGPTLAFALRALAGTAP